MLEISKYSKYRITITMESSEGRQALFNRLLKDIKESNRVIVNSNLNRHRGFIAMSNMVIGIYEPESINSNQGDLLFIGDSYKYLTFKQILGVINKGKKDSKELEEILKTTK